EILHSIEAGAGAAAEMAEIVSTAIVRCHLFTMDRLGIEYDLLPRESEILHLKFWESAFATMVERRVIHKAAAGKNAGCWVMKMGTEADEESAGEAAPGTGDDSETKIIVRSNGTVTYVGKDIAYQLWKFGLLGKDFHYARFHQYPRGHHVWVTQTGPSELDAPAFGNAAQVFNVIDSRQAYVQNVVFEALGALGFQQQKDQSVHFSYERVTLSPRCATEMGYEISPEDAKKPYVEVSGRKGQGVKADDLLDQLEANARKEVDTRHPEVAEAERADTAHAIAIGALRFFLLKFTRGTMIAFDFEEALSFDGETGPYVQYAVVRARNIFRKLREQEPGFRLDELSKQVADDMLAAQLGPPGGNDLWEVLLLAGSLGAQVEIALSAHEPAFLAKYAFQLAQQFNMFYHKHHILSEEDRSKKAFLLLLSDLVERQLVIALRLLGMEAPERM
ncbi:MAG: DALR anticodon-binding domain-containing protein, partial [Candidatus Acidiferrales bacterium]